MARRQLFATAAVLLLAGCGGGRDADSAAIRDTIHSAVRAAVADHDPVKACGYATRSGRARLLHWYRVSYSRRFRDCEQVVRFELRQQRRGVVPRLRRSQGAIGAVHVDGASATAQVTANKSAYPAYVQVSLRKVAGRWLIEDSTAIPRGQ